MNLSDLKRLLLEIGVPVHHYKAFKQSNKYIVWAEDGQSNAGHGDNKMTLQVIQGTIDYFTKEEFDPNFKLIQEKLNNADLAWNLNSIQHEDDTGYIHYEWVWELVNNIG